MKHIEFLTEDLLKESYDNQEVIPPVDLNKILKEHGFTYYTGPFKDSDVMGIYYRDKKAIYTRESTTYANKAFLVAKALGHYFLHPQIKERTFHRRDLYFMST